MKKSKIVLGWDEIKTKKQKKGLIDVVLSEIAKLRKSPALRDLLSDEGITIAEKDFYSGATYTDSPYDDTIRYTLKMLKNGKIVEYSQYNRVYNEIASKSKLRERIEEYKIIPKDIHEIRKEIEG